MADVKWFGTSIVQYDENVFVWMDETGNAGGAAVTKEEAERALARYAEALSSGPSDRRLCLTCGFNADASISIEELKDQCMSPDACTFDLTNTEAWMHWRKISQNETARANLAEAQLKAVLEIKEQQQNVDSSLKTQLTIHKLRRDLRAAELALLWRKETEAEPDYFHLDDWEVTLNYAEWPDAVDGLEMPVRLHTLYKGPEKWVAEVAVSEDDCELQVFDTEAEARVASGLADPGST